MKAVLTIFCLTLICTISFTQNCDYNYSSSLLLSPKDRLINIEQREKSLEDINTYLSCIKETRDSTKLFWLNDRIAFNMSELNTVNDSIVKYSSRAFSFNKERLCKDYVKVYVYHERDQKFPMKRHYLDQINCIQIDEIRSYCLENYKDAELEMYAEIERKKLAIKSSSNFNQEYLDQLQIIGERDQKERKKKSIDWKTQNQLDSLNRIKLDQLYAKYGFPSNDTVTKEGTMKAFLVMHHSTDCEWNERWTKIFIEHKKEIIPSEIFSFYLYRNFNLENGICKNNVRFIEELKNDESVKEFMDFKSWKKKFKSDK